MDRSKAMVIAGAMWAASIGWQGARADEVMNWNALASSALSDAAPAAALRVMATMHVAMHDAINSIEPRYRPYGFSIPVDMRASKEAAAASAAHDVLAATMPERATAFDAALGLSLARIAGGKSKRDGVGAGKAVAEAVVAWRRKDGFEQLEEQAVTPFVMKSAAQFSPAGCPALDGEREIPAWNAAARAASIARSLALHDNARLFALMYMAAADASLAGPSQRCVVSGAAEKVLRLFFGSDSFKLGYVRTAMARSADEPSIMLGRKIGAYAVANYLEPR
ncbi:MAG TPA: hypothetical protein VFK92_01690 [Burkholderiales bacterium]|nr:hypothetical protein [Burkholderiales bacterium]